MTCGHGRLGYELGVGAPGPTRTCVRKPSGRAIRQLFDFALNLAILHLDEWVHSPFTSDSDVTLELGMVLPQMDISR